LSVLLAQGSARIRASLTTLARSRGLRIYKPIAECLGGQWEVGAPTPYAVGLRGLRRGEAQRARGGGGQAAIRRNRMYTPRTHHPNDRPDSGLVHPARDSL
jgi:hypothetical protein